MPLLLLAKTIKVREAEEDLGGTTRMHHKMSTQSSVDVSCEKREAGAEETGKVMLSGPCAIVTKNKANFGKNVV